MIFHNDDRICITNLNSSDWVHRCLHQPDGWWLPIERLAGIGKSVPLKLRFTWRFKSYKARKARYRSEMLPVILITLSMHHRFCYYTAPTLSLREMGWLERSDIFGVAIVADCGTPTRDRNSNGLIQAFEVQRSEHLEEARSGLH